MARDAPLPTLHAQTANRSKGALFAVPATPAQAHRLGIGTMKKALHLSIKSDEARCRFAATARGQYAGRRSLMSIMFRPTPRLSNSGMTA